MQRLCLNFDGSCDRNPGGPGGWGWRLTTPGGELVACDLGRTPCGPLVTNNTEEWNGLLFGLEYLATYPSLFDAVLVRGDSKMVVKQAAGEWGAKAEHLKPLLLKCGRLLGVIGRERVRFQWVPREQNMECDELSKAIGKPYLPERVKVAQRQPVIASANPVRVDFVRAFDCRP